VLLIADGILPNRRLSDDFSSDRVFQRAVELDGLFPTFVVISKHCLQILVCGPSKKLRESILEYEPRWPTGAATGNADFAVWPQQTSKYLGEDALANTVITNEERRRRKPTVLLWMAICDRTRRRIARKTCLWKTNSALTKC
jgi:hypothetical protein